MKINTPKKIERNDSINNSLLKNRIIVEEKERNYSKNKNQ
jgi:hypothetical protein